VTNTHVYRNVATTEKQTDIEGYLSKQQTKW